MEFEQFLDSDMPDHDILDSDMRQSILTSPLPVSSKCDVDYMLYIKLCCRVITQIPEWVYNQKETLILALDYNLLERITPGISRMINLVEIDISNNKLIKLSHEICNLPNLILLNVSNNKLNTLPCNIGNLKNLEKLDISYNYIKKLPQSIGYLESLSQLNATCNRIQYLPVTFTCLSKLQTLDLTRNRLKTLPNMIGNCETLSILNLDDNKIKQLPDTFYNLVNLTFISIIGNRLISISPEISNLSYLTTLQLRHNNLTTLPITIARLRRLQVLEITSNPIEYIAPQVRNVLNRRYNIQMNVYNDGQNVHNHSIQESIIQSIEKIMSKPLKRFLDKPNPDTSNPDTPIPDITDIIKNELINSGLSVTVIEAILEYCDDDSIHSVLNITFKDLFIYVWDFIINQSDEMQKTLKNILNDEMLDSTCKCFTGRLSRLINVLNGISPDVIIHIADNEQIANIIKIVGENLHTRNSYTIEKHREEVKRELEERGYSENTIAEWIAYLE